MVKNFTIEVTKNNKVIGYKVPFTCLSMKQKSHLRSGVKNKLELLKIDNLKIDNLIDSNSNN